MTTEIVRAEPLTASLPDMVRYAEHLADANLLPGQYRKQPANVLYAMEYGRTLGITPLAAITGIHVIEGKPSASAALISGLVRQAGHKLRVSGNGRKATAQIIRCDDPDHVFEVIWELHANPDGNPNAEDAGLLKKDIWKKYPASMLKARAISAAARDACEEVLFGLHYTPEELGAVVDQDGEPVDAPVQQLRAVQANEPDQWATPAPESQTAEAMAVEPHPPAQAIADEAAKAKTRADWRRCWSLGATGRLMQAPVKAPDTQQIEELGAYLTRCGTELPEGPTAATTEQEPLDVETVDDPPVDDHAAAVAELRAAAEAARLDDFENGAYGALGCPIDEASADAIRNLAAQIRGAA